MLTLGKVVEVHAVDLIDDLPHELAGLHVVVRVLKDISHDAAATPCFSANRQLLELREELSVNESEQFSASDTFRVGSPGAPSQRLWDRRTVALLSLLQFFVLVVDNL